MITGEGVTGAVPTIDRRLAQRDHELAAWASRKTSASVTGGQIAGWRRVHLLPPATGRDVRRGGARGPAPVCWTAAELEQARAIVVRLVEIAGRGRSLTQVALQLADEGLPVPGRAVLDAAIDTLNQLERGLRQVMGVAGASPGADDVDLVVQRIVATEPHLVRRLRRQLRAAGFAGDPGCTDDDGELSVLFTIAAMLLGAGLDAVDEYALDATLHAVDAHGAIQRVGGTAGPRLLASGTAELQDVLPHLSLRNQVALLERFPAGAVHPSLQQSDALRRALHRVQIARPDLAHHLAAAQVVGVLDGAGGVVQRLVCWQLIRETTNAEPDIVGLLEAVDGLAASGSAVGQVVEVVARSAVVVGPQIPAGRILDHLDPGVASLPGDVVAVQAAGDVGDGVGLGSR